MALFDHEAEMTVDMIGAGQPLEHELLTRLEISYGPEPDAQLFSELPQDIVEKRSLLDTWAHNLPANLVVPVMSGRALCEHECPDGSRVREWCSAGTQDRQNCYDALKGRCGPG